MIMKTMMEDEMKSQMTQVTSMTSMTPTKDQHEVVSSAAHDRLQTKPTRLMFV